MHALQGTTARCLEAHKSAAALVPGAGNQRGAAHRAKMRTGLRCVLVPSARIAAVPACPIVHLNDSTLFGDVRAARLRKADCG